MGKVITINRKVDFDPTINTIQRTTNTINMNGLIEEVDTKVIPQNESILEYVKFNIEFYKKVNILGRVNNQDFNSFLRKYIIPVYVKNDSNYVFSIGGAKGTITRAAFKRLKNVTPINCAPIKINLTDAIACIMRNLPNISVVSGWFTHLGEQLQNALLQGHDINENVDWQRYLKTIGSELKNVEFKLVGNEYVRGFIIFSLSSRGFIHIKTGISDQRFLEIARLIVGVLENHSIIEYDNVDDEERDDVDASDNYYIDR